MRLVDIGEQQWGSQISRDTIIKCSLVKLYNERLDRLPNAVDVALRLQVFISHEYVIGPQQSRHLLFRRKKIDAKLSIDLKQKDYNFLHVTKMGWLSSEPSRLFSVRSFSVAIEIEYCSRLTSSC